MYLDSGYKWVHAQSVCTRPFLFSPQKGPGNEAEFLYTAFIEDCDTLL